MSVSIGKIALVGKAELRRHDANDLVGCSVKPQCAAHDIAAAGKQILTQRMAYDDDVILPRLLVLCADGSAEFRRCIQSSEEVAVYFRRAHSGDLNICCEVVGCLPEEG